MQHVYIVKAFNFGFSIGTLKNVFFQAIFLFHLLHLKNSFIIKWKKICFGFCYSYNIQNMINFDNHPNENKAGHNPMWPYILDDLCRILTIGRSGSVKTNALLNL